MRKIRNPSNKLELYQKIFLSINDEEFAINTININNINLKTEASNQTFVTFMAINKLNCKHK